MTAGDINRLGIQKSSFLNTETTRLQVTDPPAPGPDLQETLQGEEDREGHAGCLHHVGLLGGVTTELVTITIIN